jgi:N-acyl-D-aspartate/D-glutamate deacylase
MAHYNFPLRMLKAVRDEEARGRPFLSTGRAVARLTSEIADFLGVDAGRLAVGGRADLVVLRPEGLDSAVDAIHEAPLEGFGSLKRLVRRNPRAVGAVFIGGRLAVRDGEPTPDLGKVPMGSVLRARR